MLMGAQIGSIHTLKDLGLYMKVGSPTISGAEPETMLVNVPGSDFMLDLSRAAGPVACGRGGARAHGHHLQHRGHLQPLQAQHYRRGGRGLALGYF